MKTVHALPPAVLQHPGSPELVAKVSSTPDMPLRQTLRRNRLLVGIVIQFATFLLITGGLAGAEVPSMSPEMSAAPSNYPLAAQVTFPRYQYRQMVSSIKEVDFKNLRYRLFGNSIHLRNGNVKEARQIAGTDAFDHIELSLEHVWYYQIQDGQPLYALVYLDFFSVAVSSSDYGFLLLFTVENGHPVIVQQFDYDRQAPGTATRFNVERGELTIKARSRDGSSHCCPQNLETDAFHWAGKIFRLRDRRIAKLTAAERCCPEDM